MCCCCCPCLSSRPLSLLPPTPTPTTSFLPAFELHTQVQHLLSLVKRLPSFRRCRAVLLALSTATCLLQSKCFALAAAAAAAPAAAAAAAAAACTARCILTGLQRAIFLSLAMKQSQLLSQLQLPVRALLHSSRTQPVYPSVFAGAVTIVASCYTGQAAEDPIITSTQIMLLQVSPLVAITHLFPVCPNPVSSAA